MPNTMLHRNFTPMSLSMLIMAAFLIAVVPPLGIVLLLVVVRVGFTKRSEAYWAREERIVVAREKQHQEKLRAGRAFARL